MSVTRITPAPAGTVPVAALGHALDLVRIAAGLANNCGVKDAKVLAAVLAAINAAQPARHRLGPEILRAIAELGLKPD